MKNSTIAGFTFIILAVLFSCSRKTTIPATNTTPVSSSAAAAKKSSTPKIKTATPKVIVVNDIAARKTVDGRYYYDLNGKRYWRNNKDGKYYLFNKSIYSNPDFNAVN